jgi:hypothetical protein
LSFDNPSRSTSRAKRQKALNYFTLKGLGSLGGAFARKKCFPGCRFVKTSVLVRKFLQSYIVDFCVKMPIQNGIENHTNLPGFEHSLAIEAIE